MSSSLAHTIKSRRTIHRFKTGEIPSVELIKLAIEHAIWAPNHHLSQPWQFYLLGPRTAELVCQLNAELVREKMGEKAAGIKLKRWREIPGWLVLCCDIAEDDIRKQEDYAACCCVAQNLSLYLWEEGVGMKWTTGTVTRDQRFYDIIGIDVQRQSIVGLFWYGFPAQIPQAERKPSADRLVILP